MRTEKQLSTPLLVAEFDDTDASMGLMLGKETALEDVAFEYTMCLKKKRNPTSMLKRSNFDSSVDLIAR